MGTTAHVRIHHEGSRTGAGVYHRFDGNTLGSKLVDLATHLNETSGAEPVTPLTFAQAWVESQQDEFRAEMARFPAAEGRGAEIVEQMMRAIEVVDEEDVSSVPDWYDAFYTVTIGAGRARTVNGHGDRWGPVSLPIS